MNWYGEDLLIKLYQQILSNVFGEPSLIIVPLNGVIVEIRTNVDLCILTPNARWVLLSNLRLLLAFSVMLSSLLQAWATHVSALH